MFSSHGVNKYQSHGVDNFLISDFSVYLVHIDSPNKGHESNVPMYSILRLQKHTNTIRAFKKQNSEKHFAQRFDIAIITKYEILPILFFNFEMLSGRHRNVM